MKYNLAVTEDTFYSIQGEGKTMGYPSVFLRLAGCNLMCGGMGTQFDKELHNNATWRCDTVEVWLKGETKKHQEVLEQKLIDALKNGAHLIITGGEPMLQQQAIVDYIDWLKITHNLKPFVEVETNGTIKPITDIEEKVNQWNCSPKLSNSGNAKEARYNKEVLQYFNKLNTQFKFVISNDNDFSELVIDFDFLDKEKIWLMPSGENQSLLNQSRVKVAQLCVDNYFKYSERLHIVIWNQKTGV